MFTHMNQVLLDGHWRHLMGSYTRQKKLPFWKHQKNIPVSAQPPAGSSWVIDVIANIQELMAPSTVPNELRSTWYDNTFADVTELALSTVFTVTPHVNRVDNYVQMSIKDTVRE